MIIFFVASVIASTTVRWSNSTTPTTVTSVPAKSQTSIYTSSVSFTPGWQHSSSFDSSVTLLNPTNSHHSTTTSSVVTSSNTNSFMDDQKQSTKSIASSSVSSSSFEVTAITTQQVSGSKSSPSPNRPSPSKSSSTPLISMGSLSTKSYSPPYSTSTYSSTKSPLTASYSTKFHSTASLSITFPSKKSVSSLTGIPVSSSRTSSSPSLTNSSPSSLAIAYTSSAASLANFFSFQTGTKIPISTNISSNAEVKSKPLPSSGTSIFVSPTFSDPVTSPSKNLRTKTKSSTKILSSKGDVSTTPVVSSVSQYHPSSASTSFQNSEPADTLQHSSAPSQINSTFSTQKITTSPPISTGTASARMSGLPLTLFTTYCPSPTTFAVDGSVYSVSSPTTLTISCHCRPSSYTSKPSALPSHQPVEEQASTSEAHTSSGKKASSLQGATSPIKFSELSVASSAKSQSLYASSNNASESRFKSTNEPVAPRSIFTTFCPSPTTFTIENSAYTITSASTLTISCRKCEESSFSSSSMLSLPTITAFPPSRQSDSSHFYLGSTSNEKESEQSHLATQDNSNVPHASSLSENPSHHTRDIHQTVHSISTSQPIVDHTSSDVNTVFTTFCPSSTVFTLESSVYSVTSATTLTITCSKCLAGSTSTYFTDFSGSFSTSYSSLASPRSTISSSSPTSGIDFSYPFDRSSSAKFPQTSLFTPRNSEVLVSSPSLTDRHLVSTNSNNGFSTFFTTFCPSPTTFTYGKSTYTVSTATTLVIPCTKSSQLLPTATSWHATASAYASTGSELTELQSATSTSQNTEPVASTSEIRLMSSTSESSVPKSSSFNTEITVFTTVCSSPTVIPFGSETYTVTAPTTLTLSCSSLQGTHRQPPYSYQSVSKSSNTEGPTGTLSSIGTDSAVIVTTDKSATPPATTAVSAEETSYPFVSTTSGRSRTSSVHSVSSHQNINSQTATYSSSSIAQQVIESSAPAQANGANSLTTTRFTAILISLIVLI